MKSIIETFKHSCYNPEFYRNIAQVAWEDAFKTYFKFTFALSILFVIVSGLLLVPQGVRFVRDNAPSLIKKYFPAELVVTINKGEVSTNVTEPYKVAMNPDATSAFKDTALKNVVVIDTGHKFNQETFENYETLALLTKDSLATQSTKGQIAIQDLRVFSFVSGLFTASASIDVSQESLLAWVEKVRASLVYVVPLGLVATFLVTFLGFMMYLLPLFLFALVPFLLAWVKKIPLSYSDAYKMSLYAILPGLVIKDVLNASGYFTVPGSLNLLVFLLIIAINMRNIEQPTLFAK